jgi:hypothetical protein
MPGAKQTSRQGHEIDASDPERRFSNVRLRAASGVLADIGQPTYEHTVWIAGQLPALYDPL